MFGPAGEANRWWDDVGSHGSHGGAKGGRSQSTYRVGHDGPLRVERGLASHFYLQRREVVVAGIIGKFKETGTANGGKD